MFQFLYNNKWICVDRLMTKSMKTYWCLFRFKFLHERINIRICDIKGSLPLKHKRSEVKFPENNTLRRQWLRGKKRKCTHCAVFHIHVTEIFNEYFTCVALPPMSSCMKWGPAIKVWCINLGPGIEQDSVTDRNRVKILLMTWFV